MPTCICSVAVVTCTIYCSLLPMCLHIKMTCTHALVKPRCIIRKRDKYMGSSKLQIYCIQIIYLNYAVRCYVFCNDFYILSCWDCWYSMHFYMTLYILHYYLVIHAVVYTWINAMCYTLLWICQYITKVVEQAQFSYKSQLHHSSISYHLNTAQSRQKQTWHPNRPVVYLHYVLDHRFSQDSTSGFHKLPMSASSYRRTTSPACRYITDDKTQLNL